MSNRDWARAAGDPFLGGLIKLASKALPKAGAWLGRATQRTISGVQGKLSRAASSAGGATIYGPGPIESGGGMALAPGMGKMIPRGIRIPKGGRFGRIAGGAAAAGGLAGAFWPDGGGGGGEGGARRRMNTLNPKALNRALRRVEGFQKQVTRTNRVLRRCAPKAARGAYRKGRK